MKKKTTLLTVLFLALTLALPLGASAKKNSKGKLYGKVGETVKMTHKGSSQPRALLVVTPFGNVGAENPRCSPLKIKNTPCVFVFGENGNDSFSDEQKKFISSGKKFNVLVNMQKGEVSVPYYDIYRCKAKGKKGAIRCSFKKSVS